MLSGESLRQSSSANCFAAGALECLAAANSELLQSLQAIGGKSRRGDRDARDAALRVGGERHVRRGLEPFRAAEARLERDVDLAAERFAETAARSFGNDNDKGRRARSVRCGIPWKLSSSCSRLELERRKLASTGSLRSASM